MLTEPFISPASIYRVHLILAPATTLRSRTACKTIIQSLGENKALWQSIRKMVFRSITLWARKLPTPGPDRFWKRRKILKFASHFYGRKQNCYTIALRYVMKALTNTTKARALKAEVKKELLTTRLNAACEEHGFTYPYLKESLIRSNIQLNKKVLTDIAIWEPRSFKSITDFAWAKANSEGLNGIKELGNPPEGVILKPMTIK